MPIRKITSSPKVLAVSLILAIALLMFLGSISYKQIVQLGESADMVSHSLEVDMEINQLFSYYAQMQSTELKNLLSQDTLGISSFENYKPEVQESFQKLRRLTQDNELQQKILFSVQSWQDSLYNSLKIIADIPFQKTNYSASDREKITKVSKYITQLNLLRNQLYQEKQIQLAQRKEEYRSQISFTPLMTLLLGMFALFIFIISFLQINRQRKKTVTAEKFLQNILSSTDNIISYFLPIYNTTGQVKDFTIVFSNEKIESVLGQKSHQIEQCKMSELIPINFENGIFDELSKVITEGTTRKFEKYFEFNDNKFWFKTTAVKMENGVLTTSVDTTAERKFTQNLKVLNEQLEKQNHNLIETKSFLNNILESTSNTVSHLITERDSNGHIIDFKYLFTNTESENLTGKQVDEVIGKSISKIYPFVHETGLYDLMVKCANNGSIEIHETEYPLKDKRVWVHTTINKLNDGITLTSYDSTQIINAKQRLLELNEQLTVQNSILNDAEAVAKIGSYRWNIETKEATMSDNFFRLLDCEPNEFEPTPDNYRHFVHPKDLKLYDEKLNLAWEKKIIGNYTYRIITKGGKVKYLHNTGHFLKTEFIGVVKDITKELKNEQKLKDKNLELKRTNSELESFNRVASHDLQEPLRKIQMFISRITDSDSSSFTEQQLQYIDKVKSSANRMQTLIKYLLSYSRLSKKKKDFVQVDLNLVLDKVQEDLEAPIRESGVEFILGDLPEVRGIPFQIEQLFNNLISNSIKYHSILDTPKIEIECEKMERNSIPDDFHKKAKEYYCISVKDNGIGFEQANAHKIFELFQRLHQKNEYSGTGIGLAICKKIVEKHKGHIAAYGLINKGATFNIYLPV
ncbi:ATP-binding protein [Arenibacter sp. M-2]|uniref:ATP-binding protein n=1 Tax=unclassified Arenibacter TaxID=2615047 RepID=UPI000D759DE1|nr:MULTISPECIES: ATP-binding protein [unclassified Arenibacter]MDL5513083.1 ATP-binding protein [Arenibacter sp. M-2]PXX27276.1 PAS domain-containing protein [Arenibacter sp. ARW7G5Y1]|tara:strand:- start:64058 stop:66637 length:2580 start_codon:yes stop_codon:yes gene_type:complete